MWWSIVALALPASAQERWERAGWGWGGVPAVNYNSDEGAGFGAVVSLYRYDGEVGPYKTAIDLIAFATTKAVHSHSVQVDALELGHTPLRVTVRGELDATRTANFCGIGPDVTCVDAARPDDGFLVRWVYPNLRLDLRYAIDPLPHKVELIGGWRAGWLRIGDFTEEGPYPGSLLEDSPPHGENARVSVLQAGVMVDDRDFEPAPTRGYWVEASLRGAAPALGASFGYFGFNTTLRGYLSLTGDRRLVFADRVVLDGQLDGRVEDIPFLELGTPGGSQRYGWYGSLNAGRGIRQQRYLGRVMAMEQAELRWTFAKFAVADVPIALTGLGFLDVGWVAADWDTLADSGRLLPGEGGGLRVAVDENFIVRADVGVSALEDWAPSVYIDLRNTF